MLRVVLPGLLLSSGCSFAPSVPEGSVSAGDDAGAAGDAGEVSSDGAAADADGPRKDWLDPAFAYRQRLTIAHQPAEDLDGFPLLVVVDNTRLDYTDTRDDGLDVRFADGTDSEFLAHEIEQWNEQGRSYIWVKMPRLATAGDNALWMYYGDADAGDMQQPTQVWSEDFVAVLHLAEVAVNEESGAVHKDSTGNGNDGVQDGNRSVDDSAGGVGLSQDFGNEDFIEIAQTGLQITGMAITLEARANLLSEPNFYPHVLGGGSDGRYWQIFWDSLGNGWAMRLRIGGAERVFFSDSGSREQWSTLALRYDGTAFTGLLNGEAIDSVSAEGALDALNTGLQIGNNPILSPRSFDGYIDEVRVSNVARSQPWLLAHHLSVTDALIEFGEREAQ
ncbi:MAG: DUF2341 domain-containing protein [Myxococcota bacterium]